MSFTQICALVWFLYASAVQAFRVPFVHIRQRRQITLRNKQPAIVDSSWYDAQNEEIVVQLATPMTEEDDDIPLFDRLYNNNEGSESSISGLTLREISENYMFSLSYLGDLVTQMGCPAPIDVDIRVGDMLTGDQVHTLLQAVTTLDPHETNDGYDTVSLRDLATALGVPASRALAMCDREGIKLPFGSSTMLHRTLMEQFSKAAEEES